MKKNRRFHRDLKKQMRELVNENLSMRSALNIRAMSLMQLSDRLNSIELRIRRIANQRIVSELECKELSMSGRLTEDVVRQSLVRDIMESDYLHKLIKVEVDPTFCGIGTRYIASLQVLTPGEE